MIGVFMVWLFLCSSMPYLPAEEDVIPHAMNDLHGWRGAVFQHQMTTEIKLYFQRIAKDSQISGSFAGQPITGTVDGHHVIIQVPANVEPGGPYDLQITVGKHQAHLYDCYVGEVWRCVGQSNMVFNMTKLHHPSTFAPAKDDSFPLIRQRGRGGWKAATDINVIKKMAGTPYYFARELHQKLGVPIGLVVAGQGGTSLWNWTPEEVHQQPELAPLKKVMVDRRQ